MNRESYISKVYVLADGRGRILRCEGGYTMSNIDDLDAWTLIDEGKLKYPLRLRRWREGDWFIPFGMTGRKKVSDFLIDAKVPLPEKQRQFVLLSGDDIVWLVGRRIDDRFRLTAETENVLRITREIV